MTRSSTKTTTSTRKPRTRTTTKKTAAKTTTSRRKKAPAAAKVEPKLVEVKDPVLSQPELRKKELIDLVVERSGGKKKDAKPAVEAALAVLGEALAGGRELNLQPMGKLKVQRREEKSNGTVIVCRVRQPKPRTVPTPDPNKIAAE